MHAASHLDPSLQSCGVPRTNAAHHTQNRNPNGLEENTHIFSTAHCSRDPPSPPSSDPHDRVKSRRTLLRAGLSHHEMQCMKSASQCLDTLLPPSGWKHDIVFSFIGRKARVSCSGQWLTWQGKGKAACSDADVILIKYYLMLTHMSDL